MNGPCCAPGRPEGSGRPDDTQPLPVVGEQPPAGPVASGTGGARPGSPVSLSGGRFLMGSQDSDSNPADGEGPVRPVVVSPFAIGATAVSNVEFRVFVRETGYVTEAEDFGWSYVFASFLARDLRAISPRVDQAPWWWCAVTGARWDAPEGPESDLAGREDHPVRTSAGATPSHSPVGPAAGCRPKPNGSMRQGGPGTGQVRLGR